MKELKPIKFKRVEIRPPRYDPNPEKSKTNNSEWRQGFFVVFEDYNGEEYDYMPKWEHLAQMESGRKAIEELNSFLAREKNKEDMKIWQDNNQNGN